MSAFRGFHLVYEDNLVRKYRQGRDGPIQAYAKHLQETGLDPRVHRAYVRDGMIAAIRTYERLFPGVAPDRVLADLRKAIGERKHSV